MTCEINIKKCVNCNNKLICKYEDEVVNKVSEIENEMKTTYLPMKIDISCKYYIPEIKEETEEYY